MFFSDQVAEKESLSTRNLAYSQKFVEWTSTAKGSRDKLGSLSTATVERSGRKPTVVNAYTQFHWRGRGTLADYDAIRKVMRLIKIESTGQRIGYPKIGAGLAGGDWEIIAAIIEEELAGEDHTLVEYSPTP